MKRQTKKIVSLLLALVLLAVCLPLSAGAATLTGSCGDSATYSYDEATRTLTVSGTGEVTRIDGWFDSVICREAEKLVVQSGITGIEAYAFMDGKLKEVSIPDTVTALGQEEFQGPVWMYFSPFVENPLTSIQVASGNSHYYSVDGALFSRGNNNSGKIMIQYPKCKADASFSVPAGTERILSQSFWQNDYIKSVAVPGSVKVIEDFAFGVCKNLSSVSLSKGLETLCASSFLCCPSLSRIDVPETVTRYVRYMGSQSYPYHGYTYSVYFHGYNAPVDFDFPDCMPFYLGESHNPADDIRAVVYYPANASGWDEVIAGKRSPGRHESGWEDYEDSQIADFVEQGVLSFKSYNDPLTPDTVAGFTDVSKGEYYAAPVVWAVEKEITAGTSATTFGPNNDCTRAQFVTFLWRAAGKPEPKSSKNPFVDVPQDYYTKAVLWAVEKGVVYGTDDTHFSPIQPVQRAQAVTFLYRYAGKPAVTGANKFTDVKSDDYFKDAVLWGEQNGIVYGTDNTHFAPTSTCVRAQTVTFLYRYMGQ